MKRLIPTALLAVFLSLFISGCYTQLKGPEPKTGERTYEGDYYRGYYPSNYYWDDYWYPSFFGFPYYNYGFFYSPWWYDPGFYYYYYGGDANLGTSKALRDRGHDGLQPSPPGGVIIRQPDSQPPSNDGGKARSGDEGRPSSGGNDQQPKKTNSEGKTTRTRR